MKFRFLALLALVLGLASCQNDFEGDNIVTSAEVDFQLSVAAPELAGTRAGENGADDALKGFDSAYGAIDYLQTTDGADQYRVDWKEVDIRYTLEVYDVATNYTDAVPVKDRQVIIKDKYEPVVFTLRLVPKRNYHFVVFADFVAEGGAALDATAQLGVPGIRHEIGTTLADIKIIDSKDAINDEVGDAYFATKDIEITNSAAQPIVLQRPYGKLRVVATDLAELNLNVHPKKVVVEYEAYNPNNFNAVTGDISGTYATATKIFKTEFVDEVRDNMAYHHYNAGYDAMTAEAVNGTTRNTHITLFTDYILAENINGAGVYPQTTKHFTMKVYQDVAETDANLIKANTFNTEIPIQRNYLTSVVGNILTTATDIKVTIDDNFTNGNTWNPDQDEHDIAAVSTGLEFLKAYYGARNLLLLQDIVVTAADIAAYNDFVANGGGSIFAATRAAQTEETTTTINLNGFTLSFEDGAKIEVKEGTTVVIEDNSNNQSGKVVAGTEAGFENNGTITIEGGTIGEGAIENNGIVNVNGGTIEEDAIDHNENATIGQYVYTVAELQAAIDAAKDTATETGLNKIEIGFGADIEGDVDVYIAQKEGVNLTINGRGFKFNRGFIVDGQNRSTGTDTVLITNINFYTEENTALTFVSLPGTYNGLKERYSHNVTIDGCTFAAATLSEDVGAINAQKTYHLAVKNCTATNLHSLLQVQSCDNDVTVENVKVVNCKSGISVGNTKTTKITNAQIAAQKYGVRLDGAGERKVEVTIARSSIEAYAPVVARKVTAGCDVKVDVTGTTLKNIDGLYDIVIAGNKDYEDGNITPTTPEGTWEVVGADSYVVFPRDRFIETGADLKSALEAAGAANAGNTTVVLKKDAEIDMTDVEWEPIYVNGYQGADIVTLIGNGATLKNLDAPLFKGGFAGGSGIVIKDLTITESNVDSTNTQGSGAFIECADSMETITLDNCHFTNSTLSGSRTGGLVGWTSGYSNQNDGPVKTYVTIKNCSVVGVEINATGAVGGINGHAGASDWTYTTIENCTVKDCKINSTDDGDWRTGIVLGTANVGEVTINNITESGNTIAQIGKEAPTTGFKRNYYGRFVGGSTGKLIIDGCAIANTQASLLTALADREVATVYLGEGKYVPSLYPGDIPTRESLTIIGAGADKTQFAYTGTNYAGQFSLSGFDSITIRDCEVLKRENVKEWGMVVFGSSNNANGVYTFENCTFNGVGTTGIYINENVSGATYNILNCTFNDDFGSEGAISIQNNANVDHIVNVLGCTFNNVTSNKIYVHYAYDGWTLNTDLTDGIVWANK